MVPTAAKSDSEEIGTYKRWVNSGTLLGKNYSDSRSREQVVCPARLLYVNNTKKEKIDFGPLATNHKVTATF